MEEFVVSGRGADLISFCKERFNGDEIGLMFQQDNPNETVFIAAESFEVISVIEQHFTLTHGAPGFKEFYFWKWMRIGRNDWFENEINLHFRSAS